MLYSTVIYTHTGKKKMFVADTISAALGPLNTQKGPKTFG